MAAKDIPRVVVALSTLLERLSELNDAAGTELWSAFRSRWKPDISVRAYMARIAQYVDCSPACFVAAYIYLDRLLHRCRSTLVLDSYTVHRLLITVVLAAVKFMDAGAFRRYSNAYLAQVGGISLPEMNYLELDFLFGVDFHLNVSPESFGNYCDILQSEMLSTWSSSTFLSLHLMTTAAVAAVMKHSFTVQSS